MSGIGLFSKGDKMRLVTENEVRELRGNCAGNEQAKLIKEWGSGPLTYQSLQTGAEGVIYEFIDGDGKTGSADWTCFCPWEGD